MARRRPYRSTSKAYRALIGLFAKYQEANEIAPGGLRECGRMIGISHSQVSRLLKKATEGGILEKTGPGALAYRVIRNPPTAGGVVWIPRVKCDWTKGIEWTANPAHGVLLDRAVYGIDDEKGLWALTFSEKSPTGQGARLGFNGHALALVRPCAKENVRTRTWYVIERKREVLISGFIGKKVRRVPKRGGEEKRVEGWFFSTGVKREKTVCVDVADITHLAEIQMITRKPPVPPAPLKKRRR